MLYLFLVFLSHSVVMGTFDWDHQNTLHQIKHTHTLFHTWTSTTTWAISDVRAQPTARANQNQDWAPDWDRLIWLWRSVCGHTRVFSSWAALQPVVCFGVPEVPAGWSLPQSSMLMRSRRSQRLSRSSLSTVFIYSKLFSNINTGSCSND